MGEVSLLIESTSLYIIDSSHFTHSVETSSLHIKDATPTTKRNQKCGILKLTFIAILFLFLWAIWVQFTISSVF